MKFISRILNVVTSRAKTDQISELLTAVNEKTTQNEELRKNVKELEQKIQDLEVSLKIKKIKNWWKIPKYRQNIPNIGRNKQKFEKYIFKNRVKF